MASQHLDFQEIKRVVSIPDALCAAGVDMSQYTASADGSRLCGPCPNKRHVHRIPTHPNKNQWKAHRRPDGIWEYYDFGDCRAGGDVVKLVQDIFDCDAGQARRFFLEHFANRLPFRKPKPQGRKTAAATAAEEQAKNDAAPGDPVSPDKLESPKAASTATPTVTDDKAPLKPLRYFLDVKADHAYFADRGVAADTIRTFRLGYCEPRPDKPRMFDGYIVAPIMLPEFGTPIGYVGRWPGPPPDDEHPRYKLPPKLPRNRVLFGLAQVLDHAADKPIVLTEGMFSVFKLYQAGYDAVASLGAALSDEQALLLAGTGRRVVILYDGDEAGRSGTRAAAGRLLTRCFVRAVRLPDGQQPDHLAEQDLRELLAFIA